MAQATISNVSVAGLDETASVLAGYGAELDASEFHGDRRRRIGQGNRQGKAHRGR